MGGSAVGAVGLETKSEAAVGSPISHREEAEMFSAEG